MQSVSNPRQRAGKQAGRPSAPTSVEGVPVDGSGGARSWERAGTVLFAVAAAAGGVWLLLLGRGLTFFYDEWNFVEAHRQGFWSAMLTPHNGHPSMIPVAVYRALFALVGLRHYWPYRVVLIGVDVACAAGLFAILRRRVHPLVAAAAGGTLVVLGPAWQDLLWPFQVGFLGSVAGGLWCLALVDRRTRASDIGACACLAVAIGCSGVGLPFIAATAVELLWGRSWRRLWIPVVPTILFLAWNETKGSASTSVPAVGDVVHYVVQAGATTVGAVFGLGPGPGGVIAAVLAVVAVLAVARAPATAARLVGALVGLLVFWVLAVLARGTLLPVASRYLYPGAALVLVAIGELPGLLWRRASATRTGPPQPAEGGHRRRGHHAKPSPRSPAGTIVAVAVVGVAGLIVWGNSATLIEGKNGLLSVSLRVRAELGGVELAGRSLPATFQPDAHDMPQVTVGPYLQAVHDLGSLADPPATLRGLDEPNRLAIDAMVLAGAPIRAHPLSGQGLPGLGPCPVVAAAPGPGARVVTLPAGGLIVRAPADTAITVDARFLATSFAPVSTVPAGGAVELRWQGSTAAVRWQLELTPTHPGGTPPSCAPG